MKTNPVFRAVFLSVLLASLVPLFAVRADEPAAPAAAAAMAKDPASPELIEKADLIARVMPRRPKEVEGGTIYGMASRMEWLEPLKGPEGMRRRQLFVPANLGLTLTEKDEWIIFAQSDSEHDRIVLTDAFNVKELGEEKALAACNEIREKAGQQRKIAVTMTTDKPSYISGEDVQKIWQIKNISAVPAIIYVGPYAFQNDVIIDGRAHGTGTGGTHTRTHDDYKTLAPGEVYERRGNIGMMIPEGTLGIRMAYVSEDNWVLENDKKTRSRIAGVVYANEKVSLNIPIAAPPASLINATVAKLSSKVWAEQLEAMRFLSVSKEGAARLEVRAMAKHPWQEVRMLAADALTLGGGALSLELHDLLYDPSVEVRTRTRDMVRTRGIAESSVSILALKMVMEEAIAKGALPETMKSNLWLYDSDLTRLRDPRLGDLLAELLKAGQTNGSVLNYLAGTAREIRISSSDPGPTPEQKGKILTAWEQARAEVKNPYTREQLDQEIAKCRAQVFQGFEFLPQFATVRDLMKKLHDDPRGYGKPEEMEAIAALGADAVPAILFLLRNSYQEYDSAGVFSLLGKWKAQAAMDYLLQQSYKQSEFAPLAAVRINKEQALPQLRYLYDQKQSFGAAIALVSVGENRAVPLVMKWLPNTNLPFSDEVANILVFATGQNLRLTYEWKKWWDAEGSKREWK